MSMTFVRVLVLAALCTAGCNVSRGLFQAGIPGVSTRLAVTQVEARGGYLDATLSGEATTLRTFAPASEDCAFVLEPEAAVAYRPEGAGRITRGERRCDAVGIGSLDEWRRRRPDPTGLRTSPVPREQASYRVVYEDADVFFLRGRFPLAELVGWSSFDDTIAVVPRSAACEGPARGGVASMEYYPSGRKVLVLVSRPEPCPILGLLRPLAGGAGG